MEIKGRYYFFALITCFLGAFIVDRYAANLNVQKLCNIAITAILMITTARNLLSFDSNDFGKEWYAPNGILITNYATHHPFRIYNFSWIMLICFLFVKIMTWCDKHLSHKIN